MIELGRVPLTYECFERVVYEGEQVGIAQEARVEIEEAAAFVAQKARSGDAVYGVTTGFGANRDRVIEAVDAEKLQEHLLVSHACGLGDPLPREVVRGMMLLRINALCQGKSGIRASTLDVLVGMLNRGVHPVVPELGSVGASGDLCPLAHMCLPIIGEGEASYGDEVIAGAEALERAGLKPVRLTYKEGLALLNGTQAMTAVGLVSALRFARLLDMVDAIGAMSLEAVAGRLVALDPRIHEARGRRGQAMSAAISRRMLAGSELAGARAGSIEGKTDYVQDSYCLRCMPQVHGASRDVLAHVVDVLVVEANAVTDNPLVFVPEPDRPGAILSGGNFHGQPVAMAMDYLKIAISEVGSISERRCAKLTDKHFSEGLPPFLVSNPGLNSGMMIPQYVAAALVSENKSKAFPASVDSIPTSANMEDHVSMGMHAAVHAYESLAQVERIVGIEYLISAQALDLRGDVRLGEGTGILRDTLREVVSFMETDRVLYPDIKSAISLVREGVVAEAIAPILEGVP